MRDQISSLGYQLLKKKKLVVDEDSDDDVDYSALAEEAGIEYVLLFSFASFFRLRFAFGFGFRRFAHTNGRCSNRW